MTAARYTQGGRGFTVTERRRGHVYGRFDGQTTTCMFSAAYFAECFVPDAPAIDGQMDLFGEAS